MKNSGLFKIKGGSLGNVPRSQAKKAWDFLFLASIIWSECKIRDGAVFCKLMEG